MIYVFRTNKKNCCCTDLLVFPVEFAQKLVCQLHVFLAKIQIEELSNKLLDWRDLALFSGTLLRWVALKHKIRMS